MTDDRKIPSPNEICSDTPRNKRPSINDRLTIVETERRNHRELSYGYVRVFWWLRYLDGKTIISVPPGCSKIAERFILERHFSDSIPNSDDARELFELLNKRQLSQGGLQVERILWDKVFACDRGSIREVEFHDRKAKLKRLTRKGLKYDEGIWPPEHCFPDGVVYGVIVDGKVVSVAYAHRTGIMEDRVADLGLFTAEAFRRRGYAKAGVHSVTKHFIEKGGEAWYGCSPDNVASIATARSVGYIPYAESMVFATKMVQEE